MSGVFEARFLGSCVGCGDDIDPGQQVRYDGDDRLVHAACEPDESTPVRERPACPSCWTVHAGECM